MPRGEQTKQDDLRGWREAVAWVCSRREIAEFQNGDEKARACANFCYGSYF